MIQPRGGDKVGDPLDHVGPFSRSKAGVSVAYQAQARMRPFFGAIR